MIESKFPAVIDNTIRKAFVGCPTQAMYRHVMNMRPSTEESVDLLFGGAFAAGVETARKAFYEMLRPVQDAIQMGIEVALAHYGDFRAPDRSYKTRDRLVGALRFYFETWPLGEDGLTPFPGGIECTFSIELPLLHPDTLQPIRYAGRYDLLAHDSSNRIYIVDEKTTSRLGDSWNAQWDLDSQMTGYIWSVLHERGYVIGQPDTAPDVEVMAQIRGISILVRDYGHVEIPLMRPLWMIDRWYNQMLRDVTRMVRSYNSGSWDVALHASSCVAYNRPCDYSPLCRSPNPERLLEGSYKQVVWNPLAVKKGVV